MKAPSAPKRVHASICADPVFTLDGQTKRRHGTAMVPTPWPAEPLALPNNCRHRQRVVYRDITAVMRSSMCLKIAANI